MNTLIIPGYFGSGEGHWQTWMESRVPGASRVEQEWDKPILNKWAENIRAAIDQSSTPVWLIAHSFGCLATVAAATGQAGKIAGAMLVAPANPERFVFGGVRSRTVTGNTGNNDSIIGLLPSFKLAFPSLVVASTNDPWISHEQAYHLADCWDSRFITLENAGHINIESGFGPWPQGMRIFEEFKSSLKTSRIMPAIEKIAVGRWENGGILPMTPRCKAA